MSKPNRGSNDAANRSRISLQFDLDRWTWVMIGFAVLIAVVQLFTEFLRSNGYEPRLMNLLGFLDTNQSLTFNAWFSSLLMAATAVGAAAASKVSIARVRRGFIVLSLLLFYVSLDKATSVHELILGELPKFIDVNDWKWVMIGWGLVVLASFYLLGLLRGVAGAARFGLVLGGAVFLIGAVAFDFVGGVSSDETLRVVFVVEEFVEVVGMIILARTCFLTVRHGLTGFTIREVLAPGGVAVTPQA